MTTIYGYAQKQGTASTPVSYQPELDPYIYLPPSIFQQPIVGAPLPYDSNSFLPDLNSEPMRGQTFNPFQQTAPQLSPLGTKSYFPVSKPVTTTTPSLSSTPESTTTEDIELRPTSENPGGDLLIWALVLGGLAAMYYYAKKKNKK